MMLNCRSSDMAEIADNTLQPKNCWINFLYTYFPILTWLPKYNLHYLQCDFIAGITVGLMVLPQALAYASIARLSNEYGLYSAYMGGFVYCLFGTAKDVTVGPTAVLSLMVQTYNKPHCVGLAELLAFYVGMILLSMGILRLGFLVRFVSVPVISGFTSAAAITIAASQLKDLVGVETSKRDFFGNLDGVFSKFNEWNWYDLAYGVVSIIILLLMRLLTKLKWNSSMSSKRVICYKLLWLCGISRNALIVIVSCITMYILELKHANIFTVIRDIQSGFPKISAPDFVHVTCSNETMTFKETLNQFNTGLVVVPFLAFIETMAIGKAFSRVNNYKIQPTQELIALGITNILNSFVSGFPVTGSFSRTTVNSQSGVKTPLGGIFTGVVVILAIQFLTQTFQYVPKACLGAVIISALVLMVDYKAVISIWRVKRIDIIPLSLTFFGSFYAIDVGLLLGIVSSLIIVLYPIAVPKIKVDIREITILQVKDDLTYAGIEPLTNKIEDIALHPNPPIVIILDLIGVNDIDYSAAIEMHELVKLMESRYPATELLVTNVCYDVKRVLIMANLHQIITSPENVSERFEESQRLLLID